MGNPWPIFKNRYFFEYFYFPYINTILHKDRKQQKQKASGVEPTRDGVSDMGVWSRERRLPTLRRTRGARIWPYTLYVPLGTAREYGG